MRATIRIYKLSGILFNENEESTKKNKNIQPENKNPFPLIFASDDDKNYLLFKKFVASHIIDKFIDFSFIFQQMKYNGYIYKVSEIYGLAKKKWLYNRKRLGRFKEKNSFRSLKKCASGSRLNKLFEKAVAK